MIDDSIPFDDASTIELKRCYVNETPDFKLDDFGNDIRPAQVQQVYWQTESLYENNVGTENPYIFRQLPTCAWSLLRRRRAYT